MELKLWVFIPCVTLYLIIFISRMIIKRETRQELTEELKEIGFVRGTYHTIPCFNNILTMEVYGRGYLSDLLVGFLLWWDINIARVDQFQIWIECSKAEMEEYLEKHKDQIKINNDASNESR